MTYRQKNLLRRVVSFICALAMMLSMLSFSVIADEGTYTINGYSKQNIIEDSSGNTIPGFAFCLDSKLHTPFKSNPEAIFTRVKLSEIDEYEKYYVDDNNVTHTLIKTFDDVKRTRLLKLLVFYSDIRKWARANVRTYPDKEWLLENIDSLNTTSSLVRSSWSELSESDRMKKIEDQLDSNWSSFITNPELVQRLIWTVVYEDEYWPEFVEDDGTTTGKSDNYKIREKYFYISSDPYNDEHSLWNIAYVPFLEYIDSIDDSAVENYDAWVYVTEADDVQSMLGAAFLISEEEDKTYISKTDIAGSGEVKGAVLKLSGRDRDNKSIIFSERQKKQLEDFSGELLEGEKVLSWTSGLSSAVIGGLPDGTYILHEESAPNGYKLALDITFVIESGKVVEIDGTPVSTDTVVMRDEEDTTTTEEQSSESSSEEQSSESSSEEQSFESTTASYDNTESTTSSGGSDKEETSSEETSTKESSTETISEETSSETTTENSTESSSESSIVSTTEFSAESTTSASSSGGGGGNSGKETSAETTSVSTESSSEATTENSTESSSETVTESSSVNSTESSSETTTESSSESTTSRSGGSGGGSSSSEKKDSSNKKDVETETTTSHSGKSSGKASSSNSSDNSKNSNNSDNNNNNSDTEFDKSNNDSNENSTDNSDNNGSGGSSDKNSHNTGSGGSNGSDNSTDTSTDTSGSGETTDISTSTDTDITTTTTSTGTLPKTGQSRIPASVFALLSVISLLIGKLSKKQFNQ